MAIIKKKKKGEIKRYASIHFVMPLQEEVEYKSATHTQKEKKEKEEPTKQRKEKEPIVDGFVALRHLKCKWWWCAYLLR